MNKRARDEAPRFLIVGAGLSGSVLARMLAEGGCKCDVFEERGNVAGHCHTDRDPETGVLVHRHGPHTLHSDDQRVWDFVERFAVVHPYKHVKLACVAGVLFPFPINLQTLRQFYERQLEEPDARELVAADAAAAWSDKSKCPSNFEETALARIGRPLYEAFVHGYTLKQWGRHPKDLPCEIFSRLPIRFNSDQNYFHHDRQGQPLGGFTLMVERILSHSHISLYLQRPFPGDDVDTQEYNHVFYSGPIDRYFGWRHGRLSYRTLRFEEERGIGVLQSCAVINYCDANVPFTRITEHKHFSTWESPAATIRTFEYASECAPQDTPYYPVRLAEDRRRLEAYVASAFATPGVSFIGRLGTYRYIDMDVAISEAMLAAVSVLASMRSGKTIPPFFTN